MHLAQPGQGARQAPKTPWCPQHHGPQRNRRYTSLLQRHLLLRWRQALPSCKTLAAPLAPRHKELTLQPSCPPPIHSSQRPPPWGWLFKNYNVCTLSICADFVTAPEARTSTDPPNTSVIHQKNSPPNAGTVPGSTFLFHGRKGT